MIDRLYVSQKRKDNRESLYIKSFTELGLSGKINEVKVLDCYLVSHQTSSENIHQIGNALINHILEEFSVNNLFFSKIKKFTYALEIGFLPGVTDNVGNTARETIIDLLHLENSTELRVYSSKIFLITGKISQQDINKISSSLHNSLIEKADVYTFLKLKKDRNLSLTVPEVNLNSRASVLKVDLDISKNELIKIGQEGILDLNQQRRGPLALDLDSMQTIKKYFEKLGRNPTDIEIESLAQTWSEHCKHTIFADPIDNIKDGLYKTYIKGATNVIRKNKGKRDFCVSVFSDNSGGVVFDENFLITHKVETHNSPSALDPYGGAITGIVGVNRDTIGFGLGAKPVANVYGFCVGEPTDTTPLYRDKNKKQKMFPPKRIMEGVIKGVNVGGNCSGIPTPSGFIKFDDRYRGKPLVFAGTIGLIPRKLNGRNSHEKSAEAGDYIVMVGGRVGADGIHGATFSSVVMDSGSPATAVQIGDPITQKKLSDAIVKEARNMNLYNSITDNGAGGISCSVAEMAKECGGARVDLEKVPLKYPGLEPWQIWISESQERMTLSIPKKKMHVFKKLMETRGVEATIIGEYTNSGKCEVNYNGHKIMEIDMDFLHDGLPKHHLKTTRFIQKNQEPLGHSQTGEAILKNKSSYAEDLLNLLQINNISSFAFISEQYDHEVQSSSVLKPLSGAGRINTEVQVIRPVLNSEKGVVLTSALYPSYGDISTYHMAACTIDTAVRNIVSAGGTLNHLSILDNFCWCSSDDKKHLWQLVETVKACYDYAVGYGTPFISGKDSMFNDFKGYDKKGNSIKISIPPTLLISAISVMPDMLKVVSPEFKEVNDVIYLLGETDNELGAGEYFKMLAKKNKNNAIGNNVPMVNIDKNFKTYQVLEKVIDRELLASSMSVTSGGLAIALAKASVGGMLGCDISVSALPGNAKSIEAKLFSESQGRILVSVSPRKVKEFEKMVKNIPHTKLGKVTENKKFIISDDNKKIININIRKLSDAYHKFSNKLK
ncbi:phosphoribosylformylglycinamidine synthase [Candidatus Nomurabacteria bacterium CG10_big_fil_rev_8_21_14_0_10_35_16]|uniref:Phosphoribosylformylglycinamidine synthase subunit PurL n=1 Tax=Candidatus Nomurabacteria bacterium CG10_big_fil_rev_8_21_14_0_10_35_16 TaxID=1974731 RepID=A0A2H0TAQ1_9BACT|nr:MAG: phosphoribosylformylglycinamidine synthase [Candidatus Nomurabacteria bacterium CG10_big_fil_rev_8_21_14_0_10_35_16]